MTATTSSKTFSAPGATIAYDVRGDLRSGTPLLLIGSPMDASGFTALADQITDRPVVTYDPRGTARSTREDGDGELRPTDHVADLHQLVETLDAGPVDVFASSGGAVNALAWISRHPDDVRTLVAHEPPTPTVLPDRAAVLAAVDDIAATYQRDGFGTGMAKFIAVVSQEGEFPADLSLDGIDPVQFGLPAEDDGTRGDALLQQNMRGCNYFEQDLDAIRNASTRVVLARGAASGDVMAARSATAIAEQTGRELVEFPGDHTGFAPPEWGMGSDPVAFAARLLDVLPDNS